MSAGLRAGVLPGLALALVAGVVGAQVAAGGGDFAPLRPADACADRAVTSQADGIEGLTEQLVLRGIDDAACTLDVSREALTLELAQQEEPTDAQVDAVRDGLRAAVGELADEDALPPSSSLVDEALEGSDLNRFVKGAIRLVPDSVVDDALPTEDVLTRAVDELDVRAVLSDLDDAEALNEAVQDAVTQAVRDELTDRVRNLV
ncbi:hypothetical protein INN71_09715 [Nocardioides sp. ChNu-153]|uniref:hypothetical protein n=1 Tax=unclassified Nocardioides TaxID=2615069 RepID=UPI002404BBA1|nr:MULTISPECIES: hypothetical protein [unclassified Nocardioides]MDF9715683.1 hypothetical protein [Nocardioides sp. ChNu-99]MDN7121666.1 hypothetical protein [Nocardioides sp. ChNu-153]